MSKKTTAQKLKSVKSYKKQEQLLLEWKDNWYKDQYKTIHLLRQAAMSDDHNTIMYAIDMLQGMTEKRFGTLENMIMIINNRDYELLRDETLQPQVEDEYKEYADKKDTDVKTEQEQQNCVTSVSKAKDMIKEINIEEMAKFYRGGMSCKDLSMDYGISEEKVVKLLVTEGSYTSDLYDKIKDMRLEGKSDDEIMNIIGLTKKSFQRYVPYTRGVYGLNEPSDKAKRLREWRKKKAISD